MSDSYLFASHQPLCIRFLLLFKRRRVEPQINHYFFVFKDLWGQRYLVEIYRKY
jgi:hypothetical protein